MQVQHIWLAALPGGTKADKPFRVEASSLLVQLSDDDLCSSVSIGDAVDIVGQAHFSPESSKAGNKLLGDVQVLQQLPDVTCGSFLTGILRYLLKPWRLGLGHNTSV